MTKQSQNQENPTPEVNQEQMTEQPLPALNQPATGVFQSADSPSDESLPKHEIIQVEGPRHTGQLTIPQ